MTTRRIVYSRCLGCCQTKLQYLNDISTVSEYQRDENGQTPLHWSCSIGDLCTVRAVLMENRRDINIQCHYGRTALHIAASNGYLSIVHHLLLYGAEVARRDIFGKTALHMAAAIGDIDIVRLLLTTSLDTLKRIAPHATRKKTKTILATLNWSSCERCTQQLVNIADNENNTAIDEALLYQHAEVELFLKQFALTLKSPDAMPCPEHTMKHPATLALRTATKSHRAVRSLCSAGADVNFRDEFGNTALHYVNAGGADSASVVQTLVDNGADLNARNTQGKTPMHTACCRLQLPVVDALLRNHADPSTADIYDATPLHYAVLHHEYSVQDRITFAKYSFPSNRDRLYEDYCANLTVCGYSERAKNKDDQIDYLACCILNVDRSAADNSVVFTNSKQSKPIGWQQSHQEQIRCLSMLLESNSDVVNARDRWHRTPMHIASALGYCDVVRCLVEHGADYRLADILGRTPLHEAVLCGSVELVTYLLNKLANSLQTNETASSFVNARDFQPGSTALHLAVERSYDEVINVLLEHGADVNIQDYTGYSALHVAVEADRSDIVSTLLHCGADVNAQDLIGNTPLHLLNGRKSADIFRLLLQHSADINARNCLGRTTLHLAVAIGHNVQQLTRVLEASADVNCRDDYGNTALHWVRRYGRALAKLLFQTKIDVNARNVEGMTALHFACINHDVGFVQRLLENGANCNVADIHGAFPVHYAVHFHDNRIDECGGFDGTIATVKAMKNKGALCHTKTHVSLQTPLHILCRNEDRCGCGELVQLVCTDVGLTDLLGNTGPHYAHELFDACNTGQCISFGHKRNKYGLTGLMSFAKCGMRVKDNPKCIETERDPIGRTVLHLYCASLEAADAKNTARSLDQFAELFNDKDMLKRTCLHHFCIRIAIVRSSDYDSVKLMAERFRNQLNERDCFGRTALFYAVLYQKPKFCEILLSAGADPTIADNDGIVVMDLAEAIEKLYGNRPNGLIHHQDKVVLFDDIELSRHEYEPSDAFRMYTEFVERRKDREYCQLVKELTTDLVTNVMKRVADIDQRFLATPILVGSSHENVRSKLPDEYDFLIVLDSFSNVFEPVESDMFPGYTQFRLRKCCAPDSNYGDLCDADQYLLPFRVKEILFALLVEAVTCVDLWTGGAFEFLKLKINKKLGSPAIEMELFPNRFWSGNKLYLGYEYRARQNIRISVDFVPAVRTNGKIVERTLFADYVTIHHPHTQAEEFAIMKSPSRSFGGSATRLCSASFVHLESELIRCSPAPVRAAYMWLKHINGEMYDDGNSLHKYMLKTCVLFCLISGKFNELENVNDVTTQSLELCIRILVRQIWTVVLNDSVPSISNPVRFLPVWESEPFARFAIFYLRRYCLPYTTDFFDPKLLDGPQQWKSLLPFDALDRIARLNSHNVKLNLHSMRKRFSTTVKFASKLLSESEMRIDLHKPPSCASIDNFAVKMMRFASIYDDVIVDRYVNIGNKLDSLEPTYITAGDANRLSLETFRFDRTSADLVVVMSVYEILCLQKRKLAGTD